jgi:hypothetical protein
VSENGQVDTQVAEQAVQVAEPVGPVEKLWLHPDALRPRDYIRGQTALAAVLAELGFENCYDFLGGPYAYPWMMWALRSRTNPDFTWDDALDSEFHEFRMGDDERPQTPPLELSGKSGSTPGGSGSTRRRPKPAPEPASESSST